MVEALKMDCRAEHTVYTNGCVHLPYRGYVISIASDMPEVRIFGTTGKLTAYPLFVYQGCIVSGIARCKSLIDSALVEMGKFNLCGNEKENPK